MAKWEQKWRRIVRKTRQPGVWELKAGGYLVRARRRQLDGKNKEIIRVVHAKSADEARQQLLDLLKEQTESREQTPLFGEFAASVLESRVRSKRIKSPASVRKWQDALTLHLIPAFDQKLVNEISHKDVLQWLDQIENDVASGKYGARTVNTWVRILKTIFRAASPRFSIVNPTDGVSGFPEVDRTYTHEAPNALPPERIAEFVSCFEREYPQHYAMMLVLLLTGLRPSSVRPLRRKGPMRDYDPDRRTLLIRRSFVVDQPMDFTKTGRDQTIALPDRLCEVLDEHISTLDASDSPGAESELLFPGDHGGFRSRSCLDRPLRNVSQLVGLPFVLTSKGFRRTFKNFTRRSNVSRVVERSLSGHQTEEMDHVYGFAHADEQREVLTNFLQQTGIGQKCVIEVCDHEPELCTGVPVVAVSVVQNLSSTTRKSPFTQSN